MKSIIKKHSIYIGLLGLSILLFSLSFPGYFVRDGIAFLAFFALIPMFLVIFKLNYIEGIIYGFLFGMLKYQSFNFWFKDFDPAAYAVAPGIHGIYFLLFFPLAIFFYRTLPKRGYLLITVAWWAYEIFKSTNVVGYSYGVLSQTMYQTHIFTGVADIIGSYTLSLLIIFPCILATFLFSQRKRGVNRLEWIVPGLIYLIIMVTSIIYTAHSKIDYSNTKTLRVSLAQHNLNCWLSKENAEMYVQAYDHLEALSREAEKLNTDVVMWSETAFVPAIEWHKEYRPKDQRERYDLIMRMEKYLRQTNALYIIGNNETYNLNRDITYNTAYLYNKDQIIQRYRKMQLVPFTESFPYPEKFPWLYNYVKKLGATQLNPGTEQTLFDLRGVKSTILICYEDAFPDLSRKSVLNGSQLLVNITNDAWTDYPATALQHLAAASLRTIETRRSLVRAGTTGFTGVIDPNGKIVASLPLFTKDILTYDVPIYSEHITFYTRFGEIIDSLAYYILAFLLAFTIVIKIVKKKNSDKKTH
ncbi:MAG: apolipoprotein N-acyltransferase [Spirochaetaceae bacterium]